MKKQAKSLKPGLLIGKNGLTKNVFLEIEKLYKKNDLIKIKILNNFSGDKDALIENILEESDSKLILKIGNTFTIMSKN